MLGLADNMQVLQLFSVARIVAFSSTSHLEQISKVEVCIPLQLSKATAPSALHDLLLIYIITHAPNGWSVMSITEYGGGVSTNERSDGECIHSSTVLKCRYLSIGDVVCVYFKYWLRVTLEFRFYRTYEHPA